VLTDEQLTAWATPVGELMLAPAVVLLRLQNKALGEQSRQ